MVLLIYEIVTGSIGEDTTKQVYIENGKRYCVKGEALGEGKGAEGN